jgi:hypothetical protein
MLVIATILALSFGEGLWALLKHILDAIYLVGFDMWAVPPGLY